MLPGNRNFSAPVKRAAWDRCGGLCEYVRSGGERCGAPLTAGNRIYDHADMFEISRDSSLENCQVICTRCNREKTDADQTRFAKVRGMRDFHLGIKGPGLGRSPMPAGRRSRISRTFRHGVQPRQSGTQRYRVLMAERYGSFR